MAVVTITIPDAQLARVIDGLGEYWGYVTNPIETKAQFVRRRLNETIKDFVIRGEAQVAYNASVGATPPDTTVT